MPLLTCCGLISVPLGGRASLCGSDLWPVLLPLNFRSSSLCGVWYLPHLTAIPSVGWALGFMFMATMSGPAMKGDGPGLLSPLLTDTGCHTQSTYKGTDSHSRDTIISLRGGGLKLGHSSQAELLRSPCPPASFPLSIPSHSLLPNSSSRGCHSECQNSGKDLGHEATPGI